MLSATSDDDVQLRTVVQRAQLIVCGRSSVEVVKGVIQKMRSQLIRVPKVLVPDSYISQESLAVLERVFELN
ncbi:MAG: hypothetical protein AB4050_08385 [Synechococcus sp.]